jgi:hypothetical protein
MVNFGLKCQGSEFEGFLAITQTCHGRFFWKLAQTALHCTVFRFREFWEESTEGMQSYCWNGERVDSGNPQVLGFFFNNVFVHHPIPFKPFATPLKLSTGFRLREFWKESDITQKSYGGNGQLWFEMSGVRIWGIFGNNSNMSRSIENLRRLLYTVRSFVSASFEKSLRKGMQSYCWNGERVDSGNPQVLGFFCNNVFVHRPTFLQSIYYPPPNWIRAFVSASFEKNPTFNKRVMAEMVNLNLKGVRGQNLGLGFRV